MPPRASSICEEPTGFGRQSFSLHSACASSSFVGEVVKGEYFVIADLLKSFPRGSSRAEATLEPLVRPDHLPLVVQDPKPISQAVKKKKKKTS